MTCVLLFVLGHASPAFSQQTGESESVLVGRITHITGKLLRYVPEERDWIVAVRDAPFGLNDAVYSDHAGKAEFVMPNATLMRVGGDTQIQVMALRNDVTETDVALGTARFYNKGADALIKTTTPFGYVLAKGGTLFDLYVGDQSCEVIALKGVVTFVPESDQARYDAAAGSSSLISDGKRVTSGEAKVDADWDDWNGERDSVWSNKAKLKGESVRHIPPPLYGDAYDLDVNGRWERVYYEGSYHNLWRPVYVHPGWRPYTVGRWTTYYGDQCWVPAEPFGYVTHHYGSWVYINPFWYWAPPFVGAGISVGPSLSISFGWYPGRVGWFGAGASIGWFPLAPWEPYYTRYYWGPRVVVVNTVNINSIHMKIDNYRYADYAVSVPRNSFYREKSYHHSKVIKNVDRTIIVKNQYITSPVVNEKIFKNFDAHPEKFTMTNAVAYKRPHREAQERIDGNREITGKTQALNAAALERKATRFKAGKAARDEAMVLPRPSLTSRLVDPGDINKPRSEVRFQQRELKVKPKSVQESAVVRPQIPDRMRETGKPVIQPVSPRKKVQPKEIRERPAAPAREVQRPAPAAPSKPGDVRGRDKEHDADVQPGQRELMRTPENHDVREKSERTLQELQERTPDQPGEERGRVVRPGRGVKPGDPDSKGPDPLLQ
jgi:hypothetical protein